MNGALSICNRQALSVEILQNIKEKKTNNCPDCERRAGRSVGYDFDDCVMHGLWCAAAFRMLQAKRVAQASQVIEFLRRSTAATSIGGAIIIRVCCVFDMQVGCDGDGARGWFPHVFFPAFLFRRFVRAKAQRQIRGSGSSGPAPTFHRSLFADER